MAGKVFIRLMGYEKPKIIESLQFAAMFSVFINLIFYLFFPYVFDKQRPEWPIQLAGIFFFIGTMSPSLMLKFKQFWIHFGEKLGKLNSRIILAVIYIAIFTPFGIIARLIGKDLIQSKLNKDAETYFIYDSKDDLMKRMERPF